MSEWSRGYITGVMVMLALSLLSLVLLHGCYAEHVAEPCEDYRDAGNDAAPTRREPEVNLQVAVPQVPTICAGPIVAGECYVDIHDVVSRGER